MYIKVKVVVDSKMEKLEKLDFDSYRVWVKAPAERGFANSRVKDILCLEFETNNVRLVSGHTSPSKIFSIEK